MGLDLKETVWIEAQAARRIFGAAIEASKASLNRSRHPAEKASRQAVVIPQHESDVHN